MPALSGRRHGSALRPVVVGVLAAVTTVAAHVVVTGVWPGAGAVLVGLLAGVAVVAAMSAGGVRLLPVMLAAQLVFHAVFAATQPVGCLQAVGRAAWAGVDLARWGASSVCSPGEIVVGAPEQVALLAAVSALPLLAGHALVAALGAAGVARVESAGHAVVCLLDAVLVRLPGAVQVVATRPLVPAVVSPRVSQSSLVPVRPLVRRGPPLRVAA